MDIIDQLETHTRCDFLGDCLFFSESLAQTPGLLRAVRGQYCMNRFSLCARYQVMNKLGKEAAPLSLWPNDKVTLAQILSRH